jgi:hypothetical protein
MLIALSPTRLVNLDAVAEIRRGPDARNPQTGLAERTAAVTLLSGGMRSMQTVGVQGEELDALEVVVKHLIQLGLAAIGHMRKVGLARMDYVGPLPGWAELSPGHYVNLNAIQSATITTKADDRPPWAKAAVATFAPLPCVKGRWRVSLAGAASVDADAFEFVGDEAVRLKETMLGKAETMT